MSVTNQPYDQFKIEKLKHFLEEMATKNLSRPYEIFVDSLKVVPKTEDVSQFDSYENFMDEDTGKLRILIYNSNQSPRNDQYCFVIRAARQESESGLGEIDSIIKEKLKERDREYELKELRKALQEAQEELKESEAETAKLESELQQYRVGKERRSIHVGEAAATMLVTLLKQPQIAQRIPGGQALAGLLTGDFSPQEESAQPVPTANVEKTL